MNHETLEALFEEYLVITFPNESDPRVIVPIRDAFLSGAGHIALHLHGLANQRGMLAVKNEIDLWSDEMDRIVGADSADERNGR